MYLHVYLEEQGSRTLDDNAHTHSQITNSPQAHALQGSEINPPPSPHPSPLKMVERALKELGRGRQLWVLWDVGGVLWCIFLCCFLFFFGGCEKAEGGFGGFLFFYIIFYLLFSAARLCVVVVVFVFFYLFKNSLSLPLLPPLLLPSLFNALSLSLSSGHPRSKTKKKQKKKNRCFSTGPLPQGTFRCCVRNDTTFYKKKRAMQCKNEGKKKITPGGLLRRGEGKRGREGVRERKRERKVWGGGKSCGAKK